MISHEEFSDKRLDPKVILLNEILTTFLKSNKQVKNLLLHYFEGCTPRDCDDGIKKFNLQSWYGNESVPTLELVLVNKEIKFGRTSYGTLGPLKDRYLDDEYPVKKEILTFFANPKKYINKKIASMQTETA